MTYEEYVARRNKDFVENETLEQHAYYGLWSLRSSISSLRLKRAEEQKFLKQTEDHLIAAEAKEREYVERIKAMGLTP